MEQISRRQMFLIGAGYTFDATLISLPAQIIGVAKQDAWMTYPLASLLILAMLWLLSKVSQRFPDQDLFEALTHRYRLIGRVIVCAMVLFSFLILQRDLRMFIDFSNIVLLQQTPLSVIGLLMIGVIIPIVASGVEVLGRVTEIFFVMLALVILSLPLVLLKELDIESLLPLFDAGPEHVAKGAWLAFPYLGEMLILPFVFKSRIFNFRTAAYAQLFGSFLLVILILYNIIVLGVHVSARFMYPNHELTRQIRLTDFLDRFDMILVSIWASAMFTKVAFSVFVICRGIGRCLPTVSEKLLASPVTVFALVCSFWFFENSLQLINLNHTWPALALLFQVLIPVLLFFFLRPKKKTPAHESP